MRPPGAPAAARGDKYGRLSVATTDDTAAVRTYGQAMLRGVVVVTAGALFASLLAGCGGDARRADLGDTTTTTQAAVAARTGSAPAVSAVPATPARRSYVARVDSVCARMDPERNRARRHAEMATDMAGTVKAYDDSISLGERQLRRIEAIPPPPGDAKLLRANVFDVINQQLAVRRQMRDALAANQGLSEVQQLRARLDDLTRTLVGFARGYGFQTCGED